MLLSNLGHIIAQQITVGQQSLKSQQWYANTLQNAKDGDQQEIGRSQRKGREREREREREK
jgi:hypothetical protein